MVYWNKYGKMNILPLQKKAGQDIYKMMIFLTLTERKPYRKKDDKEGISEEQIKQQLEETFLSVIELDRILQLVQRVQVQPVAGTGFIGNGCEVGRLATMTLGGYLCRHMSRL